MEHPSGPEQRSPERFQPTYVRPPGLEFAMGVALFGMVIMVFFLIQSGVFISGVLRHSPDLMAEGFSFSLLSDPRMKERMSDLAFNGDLMAQMAIWGGAICILLIILSVRLWKRSQTNAFLGLRIPHWKQVLLWLGVFIALGLMTELLAHLSPAFRTDFMTKVISSTTDLFWLVLGVGIIASLFEELLLRGLLFGSIRHMFDEHTAVALTAGVFAVMHMQYDPAVMLLILPMGIVLGYARARSGSIWVPVLLHTLNNLLTVLLP